MMKKVTLIFAFVAFLSYVGISQTLTWRFANYEVINAGTQLQFNVQVKGDGSTTYHRDLQVYFDYNTAGFGSDWVAGGHVTVTPLSLMDNYYSIVNTVDNTSSKIAIITEADNEMSQVGGAGGFNLMPGTFTDLFMVTMDITDNSVLAGISFDQTLMNGGQYYQSTSAVEPVKYGDPCNYDNDLLSSKLSVVYGTLTYANGGSSPLVGFTVKLMQGGIEIANGTTDSGGNYNISSIDDGTYDMDHTWTTPRGGNTILDAIRTRQYLGGSYPFSSLQQLAADVNSNSNVDILDAIFIQQSLSGSTPAGWTAPDFVFEPQSVTVVNGIGTNSYQSLCSGDVDGSYVP